MDLSFRRSLILKFVSILLLLMCNRGGVIGQVSDDELEDQAIASISTFRDFLSIPNDAQFLDDIGKNVDWCRQALEKRGFSTIQWPSATRPVLYAQLQQQEVQPTVLFYFHIDGQSVDPQYWFQADPYKAVLKESIEGEGWREISWDRLSASTYDPDWYIFARSASDSKNNLMMMMTALDVMRAHGEVLPYNLKLVLDFEEERSSPSLAGVVEEHQADLSADMLVIYDGPRHISNQPTLAFGARGIASVTLTVYGPVFPQHSGHYGNYVPNPALRLSQLLASMKDDDGRVTIPGFYDGISLDEETLAILAAVPDNEQVIKAKLGIASSDKVADSYQKSLQYPSLNIRGMLSGWVGTEARTIVPAQATAELDIRLVVESDPERLIQLLRKHIQEEGYHIIDGRPTQRERLTYPKICRMDSRISYQAFRTGFDTRIGRWLTRAMEGAFGVTPVRSRTMGGSIPIAPFISILNVPAVIVPTANRDNNQHSPNENIRLGNYVDGVKALYHILSTPID